MTEQKFIQVLTTVPSKEEAEKIARKLLEEKLAACVQITGPVSSNYWWKGEIKHAEEWRCVIKSKASLYDRIEEEILKVHPYDVPEIVAVPVVAGLEDYFEWMESAVQENQNA